MESNVILFRLTMSIVPKKNSKIPRVSSRGKPFLQPNLRAVESEQFLRQEASLQARGFTPIETPVKLFVRAWKAPRSRADLSGIVETVQDALNGIAYIDDRQVHAIFAKWMKGDPDKVNGIPLSAVVIVEKLYEDS